MNNQPYNQIRSEQGPLPIMSERLWHVDNAVIRLTDSYGETRVIKGMEPFRTNYQSFLEAMLQTRPVSPLATAEIARRSRVFDLSPINPFRFARRLVGAAFAVLPSSGTSAEPNEVVATTTLTTPTETVTVKPQSTYTQPIVANTSVIVTPEPAAVSVTDLDLDTIRRQIASSAIPAVESMDTILVGAGNNA